MNTPTITPLNGDELLAKYDGGTISDIQQRHANQQLAEQTFPDAIASIEDRRERLAEEQRKLDAEANQKMAEAERRYRMGQDLAALKLRLSNGSAQIALASDETGITEFIHTQLGDTYSPHMYPQNFVKLGEQIAGARVLKELLQPWREKMEAEIAALEKAIAAFDAAAAATNKKRNRRN